MCAGQRTLSPTSRVGSRLLRKGLPEPRRRNSPVSREPPSSPAARSPQRPMRPSAARRVLAVIPDMFFATKVAATAEAAGIALELTPPERAAERAGESSPALVLVDLHAPGSVALVSALKASAPALPVVGFFSHVETDLRRDALAAGADAVLPRSQFVARLAALLARGLEALHE